MTVNRAFVLSTLLAVLFVSRVEGFVVGKRSRTGLVSCMSAAEESSSSSSSNGLEDELERLQNTMASIEALEERNKAQLESFVDEEDQWESLDDFERELLESKPRVVKEMEQIAEELMQLWMGAKSMEG